MRSSIQAAVSDMDIVIESTKSFEKNLAQLSESDKTAVVQNINNCAQLFTTQRTDVYRRLKRLRLPLDLNGYESSLYVLRVSQKLRVILAVDEDPIFDQVIFTLYRVVKRDNLDKEYQGIAESLYQELFHQKRKPVQVS
jgi:hypothetical protein